MNQKIRNLVHGALIAALYVVLTLVARVLGLDSGAVQVRFSEALCILPYFTPAAVPGLFIGCLLSNIILGNVFWDVVFGSIATLIGAYAAYLLRRRKWLVPIPTILSNTVIIPFVLRFAYGIPGSIAYFMLTVGAGEIISCGVMGMLLLSALEKHRYTIFKNGNE